MINAWHCQNIYAGSSSDYTSDCTVTASTSLSGTPENPIIVRDDGSLVFGLGIIIFFVAITVLYVMLGQKAEWKKQFKKIF
ncbi:MAG: hypothetical protein WCQ60_02125 [bacterium]